jgi:hypothetical protein
MALPNRRQTMYQVTVMSGRKIISRQKFDYEDAAWDFFYENSPHYKCEFVNLEYFRVNKRG